MRTEASAERTSAAPPWRAGEPADPVALDELVARLVGDETLEDVVAADPGLTGWLTERARPVVHRAFSDGDPDALLTVHRALYLLYELNVVLPGTPTALNQFNPALLTLRGLIERAWESYELSRLPFTRDDVPTNPVDLVALLQRRVEEHPVMTGPLYGFLEHTATRDQTVAFFKSDSALNVRFFDLIAFALIGTSGEPKLELMRNLWDEAGRGDSAWVHTDLFRRVLAYVDIPDGEEFTADWGWQGFAGVNLYYLMGLNRRNFYRYMGAMAATEILDPPLYARLLRGCERVGLDDRDRLAYYVDHLTTDVAHGDGWLRNVIGPYVEADPHAAYDVLVGLEMRLNSCHDYHEHLHARLTGASGGR